MNDVFIPADNGRVSTRNVYHKLSLPFRKTTQDHNTLSFIGPSVWNKLSESIKKCKNVNTFKHRLKIHYFNELKRKHNLGLLQ